MAAVARRPATSRAALEFAAVTMIWGSTWLVITGQLGTVPAAWSVTYRFAIAGLVVLAICLARGTWVRPTAAAHRFAAVAGTAQFMLNFNFVYAAEMHLASGLVALVFALLIVGNTLFARFFLGSPITPRFAVGAFIGLAGLTLVFVPDLTHPAAATPGTILGVLLAIGAVVSASTANVMQASRRARALPSQPTLALMMLYGTLADAVYAWATAGPPVFDPRPGYWLGLVYLAVVASVLAFTLYYGMIRRIGPGPAAYTSVVIPVVAMALSTVFEAYVWTPTAAAGAALALAGLVVALSGRRPA